MSLECNCAVRYTSGSSSDIICEDSNNRLTHIETVYNNLLELCVSCDTIGNAEEAIKDSIIKDTVFEPIPIEL